MRLDGEWVGGVQISGKVGSVPRRLVCARTEKRSRILFESAEERYVRQWKAQANAALNALSSDKYVVDGRIAEVFVATLQLGPNGVHAHAWQNVPLGHAPAHAWQNVPLVGHAPAHHCDRHKTGRGREFATERLKPSPLRLLRV